jgi:ribosomal protein S12 methylthiotransferase accessory factor
MQMNITFPGGKRVDAELMGQVIHTDQSRAAGGEGSAPEPYLHFLASIGTCAGIYVLGFCQARGIPTDEVKLVQRLGFDQVTHKLETIEIEIQVPPDFPEKYLPAVRRAADICAVKKTILDPPEFRISTKVQEGAARSAA